MILKFKNYGNKKQNEKNLKNVAIAIALFHLDLTNLNKGLNLGFVAKNIFSFQFPSINFNLFIYFRNLVYSTACGLYFFGISLKAYNQNEASFKRKVFGSSFVSYKCNGFVVNLKISYYVMTSLYK